MASSIIFLNNAEMKYYLGLAGKINYSAKAKILPLCIEKRPCGLLNFYNYENRVFQIVYCGNYIPLHGIETIIEAIQILRKKDINIKLVMWSSSETRKISAPYVQLVEKLSLGNYIQFRYDWERTLYYSWCAENADCMLGVFGESQKAQTVIPNKVIDSVAFKIPCITQNSQGVADYFVNGRDMIMVNRGSENLANAICDLMKLGKKEIDDMIENAYAIYEKFFAPEYFIDEVKRIFKDVANKN